jgi:hypothetical protein
MKRCPQCGQQFSDDYSFCLDDGSVLNIGFAGSSELPTQVISSPPITNTVPARATTPWLYILVGALGVGFIGAVYMLVFQQNVRETPTNSTLIASTSPTTSIPPTTSAQMPSENRQNYKTGENKNPELIKTEISETINKWINAGSSRDINATMANYADLVDYYRKPGSTKNFVRNDKQQYYTKFPVGSVSADNLEIVPSADGTSAEALIDKSWTYRGNGNFSGKVRQQLRFRNINGRWLIVGERDLKVYYVNK